MIGRQSKPIIIILLSAAIASAAGDISYSKCPSSFDMNKANVTSEEAVLLSSRGDSLFSSFLTAQNEQRIEKIIIQGDTNDLVNYLVVTGVPFMLWAITFFVGFCTMLSCCVFDRSCPPCEGWKRDYSKEPYKKEELRAVSIFSMLFSIGISVIVVIAFTTLPGLKTQADYTKCGIYRTLDDSLNGDTTTGWGGITSLRYQLGNISSSLDSAVTSINSYFTNNDWLVTDLANQQLTNIDFFKTYRNNTLASPDPNSTVDINSVFLTTLLGPNGTTNTMVDDIDTSLRITKKLSDKAYEIDQSAKRLVDSRILIQTNIILSQNQMGMYQAQLNKLNTKLDTFSAENFDNNLSFLLYIIEAVLGFILVASLLGILGVFATFLFDIYNCRLMVHLSWVILCLCYVGVVLLTFLTVPGGSVGNQFCNYYEKALTNRTEFKRLSDYYALNSISKLQACIFDDANILKTFNAHSQMQTVTQLFDNIESYNEMISSTNSKYIDLSIAYNKIGTWKTTIGKYRDGILVDSNPTETNDKNPQKSIQSLNDYTFRAVNGQNCSQDYWVFDNANCPSTYNPYSPGTTIVTGITLTTTPLCISFNEAIAQGRDKWTQTDFGNRYVQIAQACNASYPIIINYGNALIRFRDSRQKLFRAIFDDLTSLQTTNSNFNQNLNAFRGKVSSFTTSVLNLQTLVNSKLSGLSVTSNCSILSNNLKFVYNSFCVNFMSEIVKIATCLVLLCVLMIGAIISSYVFALRYSKMEKQVQIEPELDELDKEESDVSVEQLAIEH